jgi:hypothetical protein
MNISVPPPTIDDFSLTDNQPKTDSRFSRRLAYSDQSAIRTPKSAILLWSGRTELNCHHEFPGLGCCVTPHPEMKLVRQVRLELTIPCLRGRCLDPIWLLTHGGTERTRTVIGLIDNQVPHLSATVPKGFEFRVCSFELELAPTAKLKTRNSKLI